MNNLKKCCLVLSLFTNTLIVFGQTQYNLPPRNYYDKATIGLINFQKYKVERLSRINDSIHYMMNGELYSLHLDEINYILVKEGTKAKSGALYGGVSMLSISLLSILEAESDENYELKDNAGLMVALFTIGGVATGAIVGSCIQNQRSYYIHSRPAEESDFSIYYPYPLDSIK